MKNLVLSLCLSLICCFTYGQASDVAHETFMAQGIEQVKFDFDSKDIRIERTKGSRILVESKVTLSVPNVNLLKYLVKSGRYGLETSMDAASSTLTISRKKTKNILIVKGEECTEAYSYTIYLPEHVNYAEDITSSASR